MLKKYILKNKIKTKKALTISSYLAAGLIITSTLMVTTPTNKELTELIESNESISIKFELPDIRANNDDIKSRSLNFSNQNQTFSVDSIVYDTDTIPVIQNLPEEEFLQTILASESYSETERVLTLEEASIIEKTVQPVYYVKDTPKIKETQKKIINIPVYTQEQIDANALTPFKAPVNTDEREYIFDNMIDGSPAPSVVDYIGDKDLEYMARIIHCESNFGFDSRRAVGTVVINRMFSSYFPDTVLGVISQKNQFSPYSSGKFWSCTPSDKDYEAAYDVLYNGYRSFPGYVFYFQSHYDGYFANQKTYAIYRMGKYIQYFSYDKKDVP